MLTCQRWWGPWLLLPPKKYCPGNPKPLAVSSAPESRNLIVGPAGLGFHRLFKKTSVCRFPMTDITAGPAPGGRRAQPTAVRHQNAAGPPPAWWAATPV